MGIDKEVWEHREALIALAKKVEAMGEFDLTTPCGLIADGKFQETTIGSLRKHLPMSLALGSALIERFLVLKAQIGFDEAFALCASDEESGEDFCQEWDQAQKDLESGVVATINDLASITAQASKGWNEVPRKILVVVRRGSEVESGLVG
jgi:hypothetical protein